ncbi:MAG: site-specific integrase [Erysipelotrichaceae bacterium]|nr:site-specific integrase [Erysipelotrichaceae bacterium]
MKKEKFIRERKGAKGVTFMVEFRFFDRDGKEQRYVSSFPSWKYPTPGAALKAAVADRNRALAQYDTIGLAKKRSLTMQQALERVFEIEDMAPETERQYRYIGSFALGPLAGKDVSKVTTADLRCQLKRLAQQKPETALKRSLYLYRKIFNAVAEDGFLVSDPTRPIKKVPDSLVPTQKRAVTMSCTIEDVLAAVDAYGSDSEESVFNRKVMHTGLLLGYALGLRPAEIFAIRKDSFDFAKKEVTVGARVGSAVDWHKADIVKPKTPGSLRVLPLPGYVIDPIRELMEIQPEEYLFARYDGSLWGQRERCSFLKNACRKAGIEFTAYQLRHNFATQLITNGVDVRTVQELMGHATPVMTVSYARSSDDKKKEAISSLE